MSKVIEYYYSVISPFSYLGGVRFETLAEQYHAEIVYKPMDIMYVFSKTGGVPPGQRSQPRQDHRMRELERWRDYLGVPMNLKPAHFPTPAALASQLVIATSQDQRGLLSNAVLRAVWEEERDIAQRDTLIAIAESLGLDGSDLLAKAEHDSCVAQFKDNSEQAVDSGVFGAPTYIYQGAHFFGQDRLDFLERALKSA